MDFWDRLKDRIKERETTQEGVSKEIGVSYGTFRKWMDRKTYPDANEIFKIALYLKTTVEYLVNGTDPEGIPPHIMDIARKVAGLSPRDREEIMTLLDLKLARYTPRRQELTQDPAPEYTVPVEPEAAHPQSVKVQKQPKMDNNVAAFAPVYYIPFYGKAAGGRPIDINIPPDRVLPVPIPILKGDKTRYFSVEVKGTSMTDAGIKDGDCVVMRRAEEPENGKVMLVRHGNESTVKRIKRDGKRILLCWEDGSGDTIEVDSPDYEVQGILVWIAKPGE